MQLRWTDLAVADLDHIEDYINQNNSPSLAIDVVMSILDSSEKILMNHPEAGRTWDVPF